MDLALLLAATAGGLALSLVLPLPLPPLARLAAALCVGTVVLGLSALVLATAFGLGPGTVAASGLIALSPLVLLARGGVRQRAAGVVQEVVQGAAVLRRRPAVAALLLACSLGMGGLLWRVFERSCFVDGAGLQTSDGHNIGDLPFHLAVIQGFARGENFPPEHPELSGARLTYPFLVDLVSALLVRAGAPPARAIVEHDFALGLALAVLLAHMGRRFTGDRLAGLLTPPLVFFSGGLGFLLLAGDAQASGSSLWDLLWRLPHDYTMRTGASLRWGNGLTTLLVTQRSFLMGLPLFVLAATLWWHAVSDAADDDPGPPRAALTAAGVVVGCLPLVHGHSFAAAMGIGCALAILFPRRPWRAFLIPALALAVPQVLWLASGSAMQAGRFLAVQVGWDRGARDPLTFWLWNTGVFIPLLAAALLWRRGGRVVPARLVRFYGPFALCFVVPNLLRLSPWIWDNVKFLFLWWVASAPLVAALLARLLRGGLLARAGGLLLLTAATLAGALDVWRVALPVRAHVIFPPHALAAAEQVAAVAPPRALVLHAPTHDSPVLLTGRRSLLGYEGHIWSQGLDKGRRADMIAAVYRGGPDGEALLAQLGVDYVLVGPQERLAYGVDDAAWSRFPLAAEAGPYRLYRTR